MDVDWNRPFVNRVVRSAARVETVDAVVLLPKRPVVETKRDCRKSAVDRTVKMFAVEICPVMLNVPVKVE
jgi:hypothetical protein